jgi:membrane protein
LFLDTNAFDHAASISFFALLSLAPLLILLVSAAGYLAAFLGPESTFLEQAVARLTQAARHFAPVEGERIREIVEILVARRGRFGLFGLVVMVLGASMVFGAIEHALQELFAVARPRRFLVSRAVFSILLIAGGLSFLLLHSGLTLADSLIQAWDGRTLDEIANQSFVIQILLQYVPVPLGFLMVVYAPGLVRPAFRHAATGAVAFFVLWEFAREAFSFYVTSVASFGVLYGSLASPILLILWTFYAANLLLISVALVAVLGSENKKDLEIAGP